MIGGIFRPWGPLIWVLGKLPASDWSVLACLGPEQRCLAAWEVLMTRCRIHAAVFVEVQDPPSRFTAQTETAMATRRTELQSIGVPSEGTKQLELFSRDADIVKAVDDFLTVAGPNVLLDISSFPKRVFFPFIRRLLQSKAIKNLLLTYSIPASYGEVLAEDHQTLQHLPLFGPSVFPEPSVDVAFVGIGFSPLGLPELLEPYKHEVDVRLLFPFPPGPPAFQRNWTFVGELKKRLPPNVRDPIRVGAYDLPDAFQHICQATERGAKYAVLAPYGPKPVSAAMCLYAIASGATVYYTQPTAYNPEYSLGVKMIGAEAEIYGYCLRIEGRDLYLI
jgi:hypothetical protein